MSTAPIGLFDSGVGGLSVMRAVRTRLPSEDLVYVADSAFVPYGARSPETIRARSLSLSSFLIEQGAKAVVIACNTATAAAAQELRTRFDLPIIAMEPAVKPATRATKVGVVGILATTGTLESAQFAALLARFANGVRVLTQPCPGLPERVEAGDLESGETLELVRLYTGPLIAAGADTVVLGCTHYPFLRPLIQSVVGAKVVLIDTGVAVARRLEHVLAEKVLLNPRTRSGRETFWTSGDALSVQPVVSRLWGADVEVGSLEEAW